MGGLSDYLENALLDHLFQEGGSNYTPPTLYAALSTTEVGMVYPCGHMPAASSTAKGEAASAGPMWAFGYTPPTPTSIAECVPPPDGYMSGIHSTEYFFADNPHYIYSAPSSKKILDNIESIIAASNAQVDVHAVQQSLQYAAPPEGFRNIFGNEMSYQLPPGFIPPVGNYRELNFKIAARIGT